MKKRKAKISFFLLVGYLGLAIVETPLQGQEQTTTKHRLGRDFFLQLGKDFKSVVGSPGNWKKRDFLKVAAVSGATLFCFALDQDIQSEVREHGTASTHDAADFIAAMGDGAILLGGLTLVYGIGEIGQQDSFRRTALLCLESLVTTTFFIWSTKFIVGRSRPSTGESSRNFHPFSFSSSRMSFPSGHAASAFAVATAIAEETDASAVDILAYSLASLAAIARVYQDKHWASDVLFGSAVGYFVAQKICGLNRPREKASTNVFFQLSPRQKSLTLSFSF